MSKRLKVALAYPALIVFVLALVNFGWFFVTHTAPVSVFISHPLGMLAAGYLMFAFVLPSWTGRLDTTRTLPPPGPMIATGRCGGRLGRMNYNSRLIKVTVYADRLTLRAFLMGEYTIHGSEIDSIVDEGGWRRRVVIEHRAPGQMSPVVLVAPMDHLRSAIAWIRRDPVAALAEPAVLTDRTSRTIAWSVTSVMYLMGLVVSIGFTAFGVIQVIRTGIPFFAVFAAVGLIAGYQSARDLIKQARR